MDLTDIIFILTDLVLFAVPILVALALLFFAWGLGMVILNANSEEGRKKGRNRMIWGLVALFFVLSIGGLIAIFQTTFFGSRLGSGQSGFGGSSFGSSFAQPLIGNATADPFQFGVTQFCILGIGPACTGFTTIGGSPTLGTPSNNIIGSFGSSGGTSGSSGGSGSSSGSPGGGSGSSGGGSGSGSSSGGGDAKPTGLTQSVAVAQLNAAGITISSAPLVGVHRTYTPGPLDLTGISQITIDELIRLKDDCGCTLELHGPVNEGNARTMFGGLNETGNGVYLRPDPALVAYAQSQRQTGLFSGHYSYATDDSCKSFTVLDQSDKFEARGPSVFFWGEHLRILCIQ